VRLLRRQDDGWTTVAEGLLGAQGALDHPVVHGEGVVAGTYEAQFDLGAWWRARQALSGGAFMETAVFRFEVTDLDQHYHLPIKFTRWGYALFRGA
jgi:5-hydroxyisourate hydrolase